MHVGLGIRLQSQRPSSGGAPPPSGPILDTLTAAAAYSTRRLRTAYAGSAIRVRRSNDNLEADIGFSGNALDTAALTAHVGANSGFVVTWYDQSGNARHVTAPSTARQPRIVNAGTLEVLNSKPAVNFFHSGASNTLLNASPFLYAAGAATVFVVHSVISQGARSFVRERNTAGPANYLFGVNTGSAGYLIMTNDASTSLILDASAPSLGADGTLKHLAWRDSGSNYEAFLAGARGDNTAYTRSGVLTLNEFSIGGVNAADTGVTGPVSEIIIFTSALSNADFNTVGVSQGGEYGITVAPFLTAVERLAQINGTGDGGSSFAVGLGGIGDFTEPVYMDRAKQARGWTYEDVIGTELPSSFKDSEGALSSLPGGDTTAVFFFNSRGTDPAGLNAGRYRLTFTGSATVNLANAGTNVTQINANTFEFDCDYVGNKWIVFTPTAFPIKATIVKTTDLTAHAGGAIFRQEYLDHLPSSGCFRFMDWMGTNSSPIVNWADYPVRSSQTWSRSPFEAMLSICTAKSATPWLCIPHQATDAFITSAAEYVRDNFAGKVRWELSNEIWNTGPFSQGSYFKAQAESVWGVPNGYTDSIWLHYAGKRFVQMMQIINTVFVGQTSRVIGVISGQAASTAPTIAMCDAPSWLTYEPGSYVAPHTLAEEVSIAPYINWVGGATAQGNAIKTQLDISSAAAVAYIKGMIPASLTQSRGWIDASVPVASSRNLRLTAYEYNNHYSLNECAASTLYSGGNPVAGSLEAFIEATYSQEMADAQDDLRAYFKSQNGSLMAFFVDMGNASRFGTWGAKTHIGHNSPIWNDLVAWHAANTRWWAQ